MKLDGKDGSDLLLLY